MYLEHFHLNHSPFQEEPDHEIYFPEGMREVICQSLATDIITGKAFVKVTGQEGSGKTLLCQVLMDRLASAFEVIYLDNPVGSFDDLIRVACLDLGMDPTGSREEVNLQGEMRRLLDLRKAENKKVVFIIDEAEKLFLATLERLVRTICDTEDGETLPIVLAGRPGLDANLEQLSVYCANVDIKSGYTLNPLTEEETDRYLSYRLKAAGVESKEHEGVFTEGAVQKIYESAHGNIRMINILAEEALQNSCSEKSFMVLLDHVDAEPPPQTGSWLRNIDYFELIQENKILVGGIGGVIIFIAAIVLLLSGGEPEQAQVQQQPVVKEEPFIVAAPQIEKIPLKEVDEVIEQELVPLDTGEKPKKVEPEVAVGEIEVVEGAPAIEVQKTEPVDQEETIGEPESLDNEQVVDNEPLDIEQDPKKMKVDEEVGVEQKTANTPTTGISDPSRNGDKIYRDRLGASASWLAGAYRGEYTIQLMMLSSDQAAKNIEKMLVHDAYYNVKDKLYILRKKTSPPTLFVFYGTYDSLDAARQDRNNMPIFLRKHHPYALSISDALKKTED